MLFKDPIGLQTLSVLYLKKKNGCCRFWYQHNYLSSKVVTWTFVLLKLLKQPPLLIIVTPIIATDNNFNMQKQIILGKNGKPWIKNKGLLWIKNR